MRTACAALTAILLSACGGPPLPVEVDPKHDACAWCRMGVSDLRTAAQLVAPLEEPKVFDDIGCLRDSLASGETLPEEAVAYVADHRTRRWVLAATAVYVRTPALSTPMSSGIAAWGDSASRASDPALDGAVPSLSATEIFGPAGPPRGRR